MHIDSQTYTLPSGRSFTRILLRTSYREGSRVKKHTIGNLSNCPPAEVRAVKLALDHKDELPALLARALGVRLRQGKSVGAVLVLHEIARRLGIPAALGRSRQAQLVLWMVLARLINQGSRLSAVRLAREHAGPEVLGLDSFDEDDLYAALDWASARQSAIEKRLYRARTRGTLPRFYLYDVSSSYLEGERNELADFGYNRDGKKGKRQIVYGLLADADGFPISVEVFRGNTSDPSTFASQVQKAAERFGVREVTFVGDRGMIKSAQIEDLRAHGFHYITAITKPQVEVLLRRGVLQLGLFDERVTEVAFEGVRYVLRRNPVRAAELAGTRASKVAKVIETAAERTRYLGAHARAHMDAALRKVAAKIEQLKVSGFVSARAEGRAIGMEVNDAARAEVSRLDGCYVLKTDLRAEVAAAGEVHDRYKDLADVERAFRTMKTVHLEARPVYVRKASRTRGHLFVVMLAYAVARELGELWRALDCTAEEGIQELSALTALDVPGEGPTVSLIPEPRELSRRLLESAGVELPTALPVRAGVVDTRKKLPAERE